MIRQSIKNFLYDNFGIGNNPRRTVMCLIATEHGKVIKEKLPAVSGYVIDEKFSQAWLLDHASEVTLRDSNESVLPLDELDAYPWLAYQQNKGKRDEWSGTINKISANEWARQKGEMDVKATKDNKQLIILLTFTIVAISITLLIILVVVCTNLGLI